MTEATKKERRAQRRSLLRLTTLYRSIPLARLLVMRECAQDGVSFDYLRSQTAPNGYQVRFALIKTEIKRCRSTQHRKPHGNNASPTEAKPTEAEPK